jgi:hypothetical protein
LLDGLSADDPDLLSLLEARVSELSPDQQKEIVTLRRKNLAKEDSLEGDVAAIEFIYGSLLEENNHGFLPGHIWDLLEWVRKQVAKKENGVALLPRGSSKSTSVTQGWLTKRILEDPHLRVGLFSNTDLQA